MDVTALGKKLFLSLFVCISWSCTSARRAEGQESMTRVCGISSNVSGLYTFLQIPPGSSVSQQVTTVSG